MDGGSLLCVFNRPAINPRLNVDLLPFIGQKLRNSSPVKDSKSKRIGLSLPDKITSCSGGYIDIGLEFTLLLLLIGEADTVGTDGRCRKSARLLDIHPLGC